MASMTYTARRGVVTNPGGGECLGCWMVDDTAETIGVDESTDLITGNSSTFTTGIGNWVVGNANTTLINASDRFRIQSIANGTSFAILSWSTTAGVMYRFTVTLAIDGTTSANAQIYVGSTSGNHDLGIYVSSGAALGTFTIYFRAAGSTTYFLLAGSTAQLAGEYMDWDNAILTTTGDLVVNGGFGQDVGWTLGTGWTISGGVATHAAGTASSIYQSPTGLVAGNSYTFTFTVSGRTAGSIYPLIQDSGSTTVDGTLQTTNATFAETLVAPSNPATLRFGCSPDFDGSVDNVSVRLAVPDVTGNLVGARVIGQLTKTAVATGSGPVYYSGFSTSGVGEYLEIPYQSAFDFGTGEFSFAFWAKTDAIAATGMLFRYAYYNGSAHSGSAIDCFFASSTSYLWFRITDDAFATQDAAYISAAMDDGENHFISCVRSSSTILLYIDGALVATSAVSAAAGSLTNSSATLAIGNQQNNGNAATTSAINCFRAFDYALTAAQVKTIYNSEKHLFERYSVLRMDGEEYSIDLDLSAATESHGSLKEVQRPISGAAETLLFNDWREFDCQTTLENRADAAPIKEALVNIMDGQTFTLDPYGTAASPDTPLEVQIDNESVTESREGTTEYVSYGFSVREVT